MHVVIVTLSYEVIKRPYKNVPPPSNNNNYWDHYLT